MARSFRDSFGNYYRDNLRSLKGYIARLLPTADVEGLANEAFARVLATADAETVPPKAYLYTTARNLVINDRRRQRVRGELEDAQNYAETFADQDPDAERHLLGRERLAQLEEAYARLSPVRRQVIYLRKVERLSHQDIADRMGISVSAIEKHLRFGLRAMQDDLDRIDAMEEGGGVLARHVRKADRG